MHHSPIRQLYGGRCRLERNDRLLLHALSLSRSRFLLILKHPFASIDTYICLIRILILRVPTNVDLFILHSTLRKLYWTSTMQITLDNDILSMIMTIEGTNFFSERSNSFTVTYHHLRVKRYLTATINIKIRLIDEKLF